jgi:hypothetical protein
LNTCQKAVKAATGTFIKDKVTAIGTCLQAVSTQIVKNNAGDAHLAANTCVTQFRKLQDSRSLGKSLPEKLVASITKKCDPSYQTPSGSFPNTHTLADIIGTGAGVPEPLEAESLDDWCSKFGGDGAISTLQEWTACLMAVAECGVDAAVATQYPRALEWLAEVKPSMQALTSPSGDLSKITDAVAALDAVKAAIDGPNNDNVVSIQCGGIVSSGTAMAGDVLAGMTFSNDSGGGLTGTMPNNGAVLITPGTVNQSIAAGYHNGAGYCAGDADLIAGNIRSGVNLFGVNGDPNVVNTSSGDAAAGDLQSGKLAWVDGAQITGTGIIASGNAGAADVLTGKTFSNTGAAGVAGTMANNGAVSIIPSTSAQTIAEGYHNGAGTVAGDTDLVAGNIKNGVNIFGVTGTIQPPPLKTGQTTAYSTGSDGDLQKGASQSFTDNGDGTITDNTTGLMWEKKSDDGSIHDWDNTYTWGMSSSPFTMNGTMVTTFLAALNAGGGFAGHTDWRIPNRHELDSIANLENAFPAVSSAFNTGCAASCTVTSCSCTKSFDYWSSSTYQDSPDSAWIVYFGDGSVFADLKSTTIYVRAVRGGL